MMLKTGNRETDLLLLLLRSALKGEPFAYEGDADCGRLLALARSQQVYTTVLPVLETTALLSDAMREQWNNYRLTELKKTITVNSEREAIFRELDSRGIRYMPLKGLVIREYYPKTSMRQMSDNDILYDSENREALCALMKKRGYYLGASGGISDDFYKKPYCTFEFHRRLFNPEESFCPAFDPWRHAVPVGDTAQYRMSAEDNYLYALGHMYKHYACIEGCGIRFVCDLYLLSREEGLDCAYIDKTVEDFGITGFHRTVRELAAAIFEDGELSKAGMDLLDELFAGGVYGVSGYDINSEVEKYGSKAAFLLRRLFPSREQMQREYRVLRRKGWLLPFYYIYRLFDKYKHNRWLMKRDLQALKKEK